MAFCIVCVPLPLALAALSTALTNWAPATSACCIMYGHKEHNYMYIYMCYTPLVVSHLVRGFQLLCGGV